MSMTQIAFLRKADLPTNEQIQNTIQKLGYDFKILSSLEKRIDHHGLKCSINGHETYFETLTDHKDSAINEHEAYWIKQDLTTQDIAVSFVWGADFAAGACIGLICIALIEECDALIYYIDDQMQYTKEMLIEDTPQFLAELNKENNSTDHITAFTPQLKKNSLWNRVKSMFN